MGIAPLSEDGLEQEVLELLAEQKWTIKNGSAYAPLDSGYLPTGEERKDYEQVLLIAELKRSIKRVNPLLSNSAIDDAVKAMLKEESQSLNQENYRAYELLKHGVPVEYKKDSIIKHDRVKLIDWENLGNNSYIAVNQLTIKGVKERRPDVILFINGIPIGVIELKKVGDENATISSAFNQLQTYKSQIPALFVWNQITVISDGIQARAGSYTAGWEHYAPWKTINGSDLEELKGYPEIEILIAGMLNREVITDLISDFTAIYGEGDTYSRKTAKYHQYWAVKKAIGSTLKAVQTGGKKGGVVWHTQGSGKSLEMLYYASKVMSSKELKNPTIVVLTDRNDLDEQLYEETFKAAKVFAPLPESPIQAAGMADLKTILKSKGSGGIVFTTIQKFGLTAEEKNNGQCYSVLSNRSNIIVMVDEAHRSNYDFIDGYARHLRDGLPNATFIGFTGTPIEAKDKSTAQVFGDYVDVYDLSQAVDDGATVKVYYEPRLIKIDLAEAKEKIDEDFLKATDGTEEDAKEKLKNRWSSIESVMGNPARLKQLANDIVKHWEARSDVLEGKAMIVTMSRRIAVDLYNEIAKIKPEWATTDDKTGVMKVVITGNATDDINIQPHIRNKAQKKELKLRAKDPKDPLQIVIVRDMWLTGFDAPPMHTMYVDKPMQGAPLMQAIARVNRTFKDKPAGLIVDYVGISEALTEALGQYTKRDIDNQAIGQSVKEVEREMITLHKIISDMFYGRKWKETIAEGSNRSFLRAVASEVDYLIGQHKTDGVDKCTQESECLKCRFLKNAKKLTLIYAAVAPSTHTTKIQKDVAFFESVRAQISKMELKDTEGANRNGLAESAIKQIISEAMNGGGVIDIYEEAGLSKPDISLITDGLLNNLDSSLPHLRIEAIKQVLEKEIKLIAKHNILSKQKFADKLTATLNAYQNRSIDVAQVIAALVILAQELAQEAERTDDLGLTQEEIAFYDAIRNNKSAVEKLSDEELKNLAKDLLIIVRNDAKTDWQRKEQVRATLRKNIKRLLVKYRYPPDRTPEATDLIIAQAEVIASDE